MKKWYFDFQLLAYIRNDGAHIAKEYFEDMKGRYKKPTDKLLDDLWMIVHSKIGVI